MGSVLTENDLYRTVYSFVMLFLPDFLAWAAYGVTALVLVLVVVNGLLVFTLMFTWAERRLLGRFQHRIGPNRWGPFGLLQPVADAIKMLFKEDIVPKEADRWVFNLAPIVLFAPALVMVAVIPFGARTYLVDLNVAVLYVIAVGSVETIAIFMAGWASGNRYALFGSMRAVAMLVSYEVPMILSLVGVLLWAGSMSLVDVVEAQRLPFLLLQPLAFLIFLAATSAEVNRPPFDLVEAESEIVAGYHTEYSGMKFGLLFIAETASLVVAAGFITALFLKGWAGWSFEVWGGLPFPPSPVWFLLKWLGVLFLMVWVRATVPRMRVDQVMAFAWKFLFPLSLLNIFLTAIEVLLWPDPTLGQLWILVAINFAVAAGAIAALANLLGHRNFRPATPLRPDSSWLREAR